MRTIFLCLFLIGCSSDSSDPASAPTPPGPSEPVQADYLLDNSDCLIRNNADTDFAVGSGRHLKWNCATLASSDVTSVEMLFDGRSACHTLVSINIGLSDCYSLATAPETPDKSVSIEVTNTSGIVYRAAFYLDDFRHAITNTGNVRIYRPRYTFTSTPTAYSDLDNYNVPNPFWGIGSMKSGDTTPAAQSGPQWSTNFTSGQDVTFSIIVRDYFGDVVGEDQFIFTVP